MAFLQPKLNLRISQKQILTPGLVQMVSVLALNRLELREMINQEMVANPVLEKLGMWYSINSKNNMGLGEPHFTFTDEEQ